MSSDKSWLLRSAVVMPDHLHLIVSLGTRLSLSQAMQRLKARTAKHLQTADLEWARGYFDRRLRAGDKRQSVYLYLFLNPYRAGLLDRSEKWPYFVCCEEDWRWFRTILDQDLPVPEWLDRRRDRV